MKLINQVKQIVDIKNDDGRESGFEELGDILEYENIFSIQEFIEVVEYLLNFSLQEKNNNIQESIFNVIDIILVQKDIATNIEFDFLVAKLDSFKINCLEYAINFLGYSKNSKYKSIIENYLKHPDSLIAEAAKNALKYLS